MLCVFLLTFNDLMEGGATILFYDGDCGFCDLAVRFVLRHEKSKEIWFSPLQSGFAASLFARHGVENDLRSLIVLHKGRFYKKSAAVRRLAPFLRMPYSILLKSMGMFPAFLSDHVYDLIAQNRKKIIKKNSCILPSPADRKRFLSSP